MKASQVGHGNLVDYQKQQQEKHRKEMIRREKKNQGLVSKALSSGIRITFNTERTAGEHPFSQWLREHSV